jgi:DNA-directed RNA polymerase subunit RPC12/RpoP
MKEVSDNFETSMSIPLDSDGFLRRECPTCERELKWKYLDEEGGEEAAEPEEGGYYCPYCAIPAPPANWLTKAQAEKATSILMQEFVGPHLDEFGRSLERLHRPGGLVSVSFTRDQPKPADELTEIDDMRRVDFPCHPGGSVKVLDDWSGEVRCPVCGEAVQPA